MTSESCIELILLGKTGNGKSSLGNTLIGDTAFKVEEIGLESVTQTCRKETRDKLTVIDTPGLFDMKKSMADQGLHLIEELTKAASNPHAFLIVFNGASRLTQEELLTIDLLGLMFGDCFREHAIVVFTHIKDTIPETEFKEFWEKSEEMKKIVDHFCGRVARIDNDGKENYKRKRIEEIMQLVNELSCNGTKTFTFSEMHELAFKRIETLKTEKDKFDNNDIREDLIRITLALNAIRVELIERQERAERERQERIECELKERIEREKREKAEQEMRELEEQKKRERAERERQERIERELKERIEREKREKAEQEMRELEEQEKRERAERERQERIERELKERIEREKREKAEQEMRELEEQEKRERAEQERQERIERELKERTERDKLKKAEQEMRELQEREKRERMAKHCGCFSASGTKHNI